MRARLRDAAERFNRERENAGRAFSATITAVLGAGRKTICITGKVSGIAVSAIFSMMEVIFIAMAVVSIAVETAFIVVEIISIALPAVFIAVKVISTTVKIIFTVGGNAPITAKSHFP